MFDRFISNFISLLSQILNPPKQYLHVDSKGNAKIITVKDGKIINSKIEVQKEK